MQNRTLLPFLLMILLGSSCNGKNIYSGDYKDLISAADRGDTTLMSEIVVQRNLNLNYVDSVYGISLLNWCIMNDKVIGYTKLLSLGANPNYYEQKPIQPPAIIKAAQMDNSIFLKLALEHGGDANRICTSLDGCRNKTPLLAALFSGNIKNVQLLIEDSVDVDLTPDKYCNPLSEALVQEKVEIAKLLLISGASGDSANLPTYSGTILNVLDLLRALQFPLNSPEHKVKMEIVKILEEKGLVYSKHPIPVNIQAEHKEDKEYLEKY